MQSTYKNTFLFTLGLLVILPNFVFAHSGHGDNNSFSFGLFHPFFGFDHLLAMVAVGVWASQLGGKATWVVPFVFVSLMLVGGALSISGVSIPFVENGILVSVLILGVLIAAAVKAPLLLSSIIVGVFALFHGQAHGAELPASSSAISYCLGFAVATILLHAVGIASGLGFAKWNNQKSVQLTGASIALCGIYLLV